MRYVKRGHCIATQGRDVRANNGKDFSHKVVHETAKTAVLELEKKSPVLTMQKM